MYDTWTGISNKINPNFVVGQRMLSVISGRQTERVFSFIQLDFIFDPKIISFFAFLNEDKNQKISNPTHQTKRESCNPEEKVKYVDIPR